MKLRIMHIILLLYTHNVGCIVHLLALEILCLACVAYYIQVHTIIHIHMHGEHSALLYSFSIQN